MGHHGTVAERAQGVERLIHKACAGVEVKLRQHIPAFSDGGQQSPTGQLNGLGDAKHLHALDQLHLGNIALQGALEQPELMLDKGDGFQFFRHALEVGRGDDLRHAAVPGQPGHPDRRFHIPGPVVHLRHDMTVDIHHIFPTPFRIFS